MQALEELQDSVKGEVEGHHKALQVLTRSAELSMLTVLQYLCRVQTIVIVLCSMRCVVLAGVCIGLGKCPYLHAVAASILCLNQHTQM